MPRAIKEQKSVEAIREEAAAFARAAFKEEGPWWVVLRLRHKPASGGSRLRWKRLANQATATAWENYLKRQADRYGIRRDICGHPAVWLQNFRPEPYQEHES